MMAANKPVAFEIPLDETLKSKVFSPKNASLKLGDRRSLSREDLSAKLDGAAERKQAQKNDRVVKARMTVERAKVTASRMKELESSIRAESKQKLDEKLELASKIKDEKIHKRLKDVSEHLDVVGARKEANAQDYPSLGDKDLEEKLHQAEERRKTLEGNRIEKLSQHHKTVEMRKSQEHLPRFTSPSVERLTSKLAAAENRRRAMEENQQQKFVQREEHAAAVRKRKATNGSAELL